MSLSNPSLVPVTCPNTGITFRVELETPVGNLLCYHPFSIAETVRSIAAQSAEKGLKLPELYSPNVLAGMLLTILQYNSLVVCKDPIAANKYLTSAGSETLADAIQFLSRRSSFKDCPTLALLDFTLNHYWGLPTVNADGSKRNEAADLLKNFIRACGGTPIKDTRIVFPAEPKKAKDKIKVYSDRAKQEASNLRQSKDSAATLLANLSKASFGKYPKVIADIENTIKNLATVKKERRQNLADMLEMVFEGSADAAELAEILRKANTDAIQNDLVGITTIEDVSTVKKEGGKIKVDFLSKLQS